MSNSSSSPISSGGGGYSGGGGDDFIGCLVAVILIVGVVGIGYLIYRFIF
jgi:hypothetical protein